VTSPALRRLGLGIATLCGARRGWFLPHRHADAAIPPPIYPALEPLFAAAVPDMRALLAAAGGFMDAFARFGGAPPAPRFAQDWFPRLDAAIGYTMLRLRRPARLVEVGSGHSTRVFARAIADGALATRLSAIDPAPRADISALPVALSRVPVQRAARALFADLRAGDILVVDSSHVLMPGSDVDLLFNDVMPALPMGAIVHVHDIFLPRGYTNHYYLDQNRHWNENYLLGALLLENPRWRVEIANAFVADFGHNATLDEMIGQFGS
jgi:predicted O-methyltransferase YrrM